MLRVMYPTIKHHVINGIIYMVKIEYMLKVLRKTFFLGINYKFDERVQLGFKKTIVGTGEGIENK